MTRILIADSHEVVRRGVRRLVAAQAGWTIVSEAADGKQAIEQCIATKPDVAILACSLPLIPGSQATSRIRLAVPTVEVVIFAIHDNESLMLEAFKAGAHGYVLKADPESTLMAAVQSLALHRPFFAGRLSGPLLEALLSGRPPYPLLSPREQTVAQLVAEGFTNRQIAHALNISVKTVETHRAECLRKLRVTTSSALVRYAVRTKLIEA